MRVTTYRQVIISTYSDAISSFLVHRGDKTSLNWDSVTSISVKITYGRNSKLLMSLSSESSRRLMWLIAVTLDRPISSHMPSLGKRRRANIVWVIPKRHFNFSPTVNLNEFSKWTLLHGALKSNSNNFKRFFATGKPLQVLMSSQMSRHTRTLPPPRFGLLIDTLT